MVDRQTIITITPAPAGRTMVSVKVREPIEGRRTLREVIRGRRHRDNVRFVGFGDSSIEIHRQLGWPTRMSATIGGQDMLAALRAQPHVGPAVD